MARNLNFLFAILVFVGIVSFALLSRRCSVPVVPVCFERTRTLDDARVRSEETGLPVLVFVTADWCEGCKTLREGALNTSRVTDWIADNTVPVYLDVSRDATGDVETRAAMTRLNVAAPPVIILLQRGREIGRVEGAPGSRELVDRLKKIAATTPPP